MNVFTLHRGRAPLLVSLPHDGIVVPERLLRRMRPAARSVPDTDWHVSRLYGFARELGASILTPHYSRYVVDLNRPPSDTSLYPGKNTTGLCPVTQFSGEPVYLDGEQPGPEEIAERVERYWRPYHSALAEELDRLVTLHGQVVLWEGHSIRSVVPFLFDGALPDLNLGTADGASCSSWLQGRLLSVCASQDEYTWVINGRFKGGFITRHYGDPSAGVDAVQLELAQCTYMDESSTAYLSRQAERLQKVLGQLLQTCLGAGRERIPAPLLRNILYASEKDGD
ncbi:MAG: N-formylglutamate deformylase [Xanthomonadales bacterium]|nr:N-formylglutamate deformylase [Xanthomonadales bacterium]